MTLVPDKYSPGEYFIHHGLYFNSRFNGLGCAYSLKFKYTGFFKEGLKHGKGQFLKYDSSESYIGNFKNNNVYGFGVIKRALQSDSHNFIPITDPIGQDSENRLEVSKHSKETKQSTNGVFHYVVTGYFHKSFHPSGFGSIVKLQNNRVFKGFLHNGLPSKIGSFFKNGVLVYTGEFGEIDPKTKLSLYKDGQFQDNFYEQFKELMDEKNVKIGYQGLGMLKSSNHRSDSVYLLSYFGLSGIRKTYGIKELANQRYSGEMDKNHIFHGQGFLQTNAHIPTHRSKFHPS